MPTLFVGKSSKVRRSGSVLVARVRLHAEIILSICSLISVSLRYAWSSAPSVDPVAPWSGPSVVLRRAASYATRAESHSFISRCHSAATFGSPDIRNVGSRLLNGRIYICKTSTCGKRSQTFAS